MNTLVGPMAGASAGADSSCEQPSWLSAPWPPAPDWPMPPQTGGLLGQAVAGWLLDRLERADADAIRAYQCAMLERVIAQAQHLGNPRMRAFWAPRLEAATTAGTLQWQRLAVLGREQLQRLDDPQAAPALPPGEGEVHRHSTSGSSGVPLQFWLTDHVRHAVAACYQHDDRRHARALPALTLSIRGRLLGLDEEARPTLEQQFDPWSAQGWISMRRARDFSIDELADWVRHAGARYLVVMPSVLDALLDHFAAGDADGPRIEQVLTLAETVDARLRTRARSLLGARITDRYSCEEIGPLAFQCPRSDDYMHSAVAMAVVEVVDDNGQPCAEGELGHVLASSLHNLASPTLRYDLGDMAAWHAGCPACGFAGVTLSRLLGRRRQLLLRPDGQRHYFSIEAERWLAAAPIQAQRVTQIAIDRLRVDVVAKTKLSAMHKAALMHLVRNEAGAGFRIDINPVDALPPLAGGKRQDFICLVDRGPSGVAG